MSTTLMNPIDELVTSRVRYHVGNAGDEPVEIQICGIIYRWEPQGSREIGDRFDYARNDKLEVLTREPMQVPKGGDALSILKTLFSTEDGFQGASKGLYLIRKDGRDSERYENARRAYIERRVERAKASQRWWLSVLEKVKGDSLPPVQPKHLREDIAFLKRHEAGLVDRRRYIAWDGGFESDVRTEVLDYVRTHPAPEGKVAVVDRDAIVPPAQPTAPPRPNVAEVVHQEVETVAAEAEAEGDGNVTDEEAQFILDMASELHADLSAAEVRSIMARDRDAMMTIVNRLADLKKVASEGKV